MRRGGGSGGKEGTARGGVVRFEFFWLEEWRYGGEGKNRGAVEMRRGGGEAIRMDRERIGVMKGVGCVCDGYWLVKMAGRLQAM